MKGSGLEKLWKTEDWWSVWLGLGIVIVAIVALWMGTSIKGWAVLPGKANGFQQGLGGSGKELRAAI